MADRKSGRPTALVAALTGQTGEGVTIENDTVSINLGPLIQEVKQRLIDRDLSSRAAFPTSTPLLCLSNPTTSPKLVLLSICSMQLRLAPFVALAFLALGVYIAKDHRRALMGAGLGLAGSMLVLGLALAFFLIYLNELPLGVLTQDAAAAFYDTLVRFLRVGLRTVLVFGLVIALAGFFTGRSVTAVRARAGVSKGIAWLQAVPKRLASVPGPSALGYTPTSACCASPCWGSQRWCWSSGTSQPGE